MLGRSLLLSVRRTQISTLLTVVALLLWSHSILYAKLEIGYYGLIHGLPVTFFIALVFLTAASAILWISRENHGGLLCLQLIIFVSALWLVPAITGGSHPFTDETYAKFGLTTYITDGGHFSSRQIWYLSWPGAIILLSIIENLGSLDYVPMTTLLLSGTQLLFLPPLYLFLRNVAGRARNNYIWAGLWLFSVAAWVGMVYPSPQGIGYFLLLTMLVLVTMPAVWEKGTRGLVLLSLVVIVFAALVTTHLLTSLAVLGILAALSIVKRNKRVALVMVLCLVLLLGWDLTGGPQNVKMPFSQPLVTAPAEPSVVPAEPGAEPGVVPVEPHASPVEEPSDTEAERGILILDPEVITQREITGHFSGSESHIAVAKTRVVLSSIFALIGVVGAILFLVVKRNFRVAIPVLAITLAPLALLPLTGFYAQELLHRLYLLALPGMAFFGATLLDMKSKIPAVILCLVMVISYPLHIVSHYGNQEIDYLPPGHDAAIVFFNSYTNHGFVAGGYPLSNTKGTLDYRLIRFRDLHWEGDRLYTKVKKERPHYIVISRRDKAMYEWFLGDDQFIIDIEKSLNSVVNCNLIYGNPVLKLYECDDAKKPTEN